MTILICGASGLVGKEICNLLDSNKIKYYGTYNTNKINKKNMFKIDFLDIIKLNKFLVDKKITVCVFLIVQRLTDICEGNWDEIKKINIDMVNHTSFLCDKLNIRFIHLSTDYVFDGTKQPNYTDSIPNPLQNYGISKLLSEFKVLTNCKNFCIVRTPVLYSNKCLLHENAVTLIGKKIMDLRKKNILEDNFCIRRPLYVKDLCFFILDIINNNNIGIYHFYNPVNKYTKYTINNIISNFLGINNDNIIPNNTKSEGLAKRPYDTKLLDNKYDINDYIFTDFNTSINYCFDKFKLPPFKKIVNDIFFLIDLDGTLINSNLVHYNSYKNVFKNRKKKFISFEKWNEIIDKSNINLYLKEYFQENEIANIKTEKIKEFKKQDIEYCKNSKNFLNFLINNNINFCIVTNTSIKTVEIIKNKLPIFNLVKKWIVRENYINQKPNKECYELAMNKYYNKEKYIIGIEDSNVGFNSLKNVANIIYIFNNEEIYKKNDCYLFDDYNQIL
ncbi:MAG: hypothetical protein CMD14_09075 [Flavobacteriales bacterium]|nr:hypothetical protein [Flavobacteriales bacterium]|tara:strand:- start:8917 stop:10422 length:1506 start_codon:yes stop_codon:yes gene_type:complete